jgi:hypothetical protein
LVRTSTWAIEVGYILPFLKRSLGVTVDVGYAAPVVGQTALLGDALELRGRRLVERPWIG